MELFSVSLTVQFWQTTIRTEFLWQGARLDQLLVEHGRRPHGGCALFRWIETPAVASIHETLTRQGIFTGFFTEPAGRHFGLPNEGLAWRCLDYVLAGL